MPRTSWRDPPWTSHAPRNTSPVSAATGTDTVCASARAASKRIDDQRAADQPLDDAGVRSGRAHDARQRPRARRHDRAAAPATRRLRRVLEHDEAAAAGVALAPAARGRSSTSSCAIDEHVLQQIAEQRVDRALVRPLDDQVIGDGAVRAARVAGLSPSRNRAASPNVARLASSSSSERSRASVAGQLALARGQRLRQPLAIGAAARPARLRPARGARSASSSAARACVERARARASCSARARSASAASSRASMLEPLALGGDAIANGRGVVARLPQRRRASSSPPARRRASCPIPARRPARRHSARP